MIPFLRGRLLDLPNARSSHCQPTPRGGGVSFVLVASTVSALASIGIIGSASVAPALILAPLIALPLALVGFLDDFYNLPASWRYAAQIVTALVVILVSPLFTTSLYQLPLCLLLIVAVTAVINFINFTDGLDGLVASCMVTAIISASHFLTISLPVWSLVGALFGFLVWNWSPAKIFMGDVGSTFLGAVFALLVLQATTWSDSLALLLVAAPLLGDACLCVLRRFFTGQCVFEAHRLHLFQRLHQAGWSHARVSSLYIFATAVLSIALLLGGLPWVISLAVLEVFIGFWLDQRVAVPFVELSSK